MEYVFLFLVIPVSDSGEAEASLVFEHLRFSLIRGFALKFFSRKTVQLK